MTVSCIDLKEELSSFVDGELDQTKQSAITSHISACPECKQDHDQYKNVRVMLQKSSARAQETAPDIWSMIAAKLPSVCESIQEDLSAYLDGELIPAAKDGVDNHLKECAICLAKFKDLSRLTNVLSTGLQLPESFNIDIWSGLSSRLNEDCVLIQSELSSFIDKEVATLRHRSITGHLTECAECKSVFDALSETGDALRNYYQPTIPEDFDLWPAIKSSMNVVQMEPRVKQKSPVAVRRLYAVAAALMLGVVAAASIFLATQHSSPQVAPVTAEAYLIDQSLGEPANVAEAVVYDHQP